MHLRSITLLLCLGALAGCEPTVGNGTEARETRTVGPFTGVLTQDSVRVEVIVGDLTGIGIVADANLLELGLIQTEIQGDTLFVGAVSDIDPVVPPEVTIGTSALDFISAREQGTAALAHRVAAQRFGAAASDGAYLQVGGTCETLTAIASEHAHLDLRALRCEDARIDVQGGSLVEITATGHVEVNASGESSVRISGNPTQVDRYLTDDSTLELVP